MMVATVPRGYRRTATAYEMTGNSGGNGSPFWYELSRRNGDGAAMQPSAALAFPHGWNRAHYHKVVTLPLAKYLIETKM